MSLFLPRTPRLRLALALADGAWLAAAGWLAHVVRFPAGAERAAKLHELLGHPGLLATGFVAMWAAAVAAELYEPIMLRRRPRWRRRVAIVAAVWGMALGGRNVPGPELAVRPRSAADHDRGVGGRSRGRARRGGVLAAAPAAPARARGRRGGRGRGDLPQAARAPGGAVGAGGRLRTDRGGGVAEEARRRGAELVVLAGIRVRRRRARVRPHGAAVLRGAGGGGLGDVGVARRAPAGGRAVAVRVPAPAGVLGDALGAVQPRHPRGGHRGGRRAPARRPARAAAGDAGGARSSTGDRCSSSRRGWGSSAAASG